jgi:hypothetical protein
MYSCYLVLTLTSVISCFDSAHFMPKRRKKFSRKTNIQISQLSLVLADDRDHQKNTLISWNWLIMICKNEVQGE